MSSDLAMGSLSERTDAIPELGFNCECIIPVGCCIPIFLERAHANFRNMVVRDTRQRHYRWSNWIKVGRPRHRRPRNDFGHTRRSIHVRLHPALAWPARLNGGERSGSPRDARHSSKPPHCVGFFRQPRPFSRKPQPLLFQRATGYTCPFDGTARPPRGSSRPKPRSRLYRSLSSRAGFTKPTARYLPMMLPNSPGLRSAPEIRLRLSAALPPDRRSSAANEPRALQVADTIRCRGKHGHQDRGADSGDRRAGRGLRHFRKPQSARADSLHCELRVSRARRAAGPLGCDTMPGGP
jgi:hypothetical protein